MTFSAARPDPPPAGGSLSAPRLSPGEGFLLVLFCASLFYGSALLLAGTGRLRLLVLPPVVGFLLPALLWMRIRRVIPRALPSARPTRGSLLRGAALLLGGSLSALALAGLLVRLHGGEVEERVLRDVVTAVPLPLGMIVFALLPALCEETLFRGALLACLKPWGPFPACVASGALFALFHGSLVRFLPVALLGFALGASVYVTGNLWVAVAGHALHNAAVVLAAGWGARPAGPSTVPLLIYLVIGLGLVAAGLAGGFGRGSGKRTAEEARLKGADGDPSTENGEATNGNR